MTTTSIMWYATDNTGAIRQLTSEGWITLEYTDPEIARQEVERRNAHLREVYADNGIILK